jgi:hypothetical protein
MAMAVAKRIAVPTGFPSVTVLAMFAIEVSMIEGQSVQRYLIVMA